MHRHRTTFCIPFFLLLIFNLGATNWSPSQTVGFDSSTQADISIDDEGNALTVFVHSNGLQEWLQSSYREDKKDWIDLGYLTLGRDRVDNPRVSASSPGHATAVWSVGEDEEVFIEAASFSFKEKAWTALYFLAGPIDLAGSPVVKVDNQGNSIAIWGRVKGESYYIQSAVLMNTTSRWRFLPEITTNYVSDLNLAIDSNGNALLAWVSENESSKTIIQVAKLPFGGRKWIQTTLNMQQNIDSLFPRLGFDKNGNALLIWGSGIFIPTLILSAKLPSNSTTWIPIDEVISGELIWSLSFGANSSHDAIAVWSSTPIEYGFGELNYKVKASRFQWSADQWRSPDTIDSGLKEFFNLNAVIDKQGNAIAVWQVDEKIKTASSLLTQNWSTPLQISPENGKATNPSIAMSPCSFAAITYSLQLSPLNIVQSVNSKNNFNRISNILLEGKRSVIKDKKKCNNKLKWKPTTDRCVKKYALEVPYTKSKKAVTRD